MSVPNRIHRGKTLANYGSQIAERIASDHSAAGKPWEIVEQIAAAFPLEPLARGNEPAERFRYLDGTGEVGVIPSVARPFCEQCDRLRLTADGQLRSCLFSLEDHDLRAVLRRGGTDDDLSAAIEACVGAKWAGHAINQVHFVRPRRSMSQIGG